MAYQHIKNISTDIKLRNFHQLFTTPDTEYYNNAAKSYIAAGYKDGKSAKYNASHLLHSQKFTQLLTKTTEKEAKRREIKGEYADIELIEALEDCKPKIDKDGKPAPGDMTNRVALIRIYQQRCGNLSERLVVDVQDARQLEAGLVAQAKQIAALILNGALPALPEQRLLQPSSQPIDMAFESDNIQPEPLDGIQHVVCSDITLNNNYGENDKPCNDNDLQNT
jgi:hypothetical protein